MCTGGAVATRLGANSSNAAYSTVCSALIGSLSDAGVDTAPRSICLSQSGNRCCISWANPVPGLVQKNLFNSANTARDRCGGGCTVSAKARHVNLRGICTTQCLSNRPDGCNNLKLCIFDYESGEENLTYFKIIRLCSYKGGLCSVGNGILMRDVWETLLLVSAFII